MLFYRSILYSLFLACIANLFYGFSSNAMQQPIEQQYPEYQTQQISYCPVCREVMTQDQDAHVQLSCHSNHIFHKLCLEQWCNHRMQRNQALICLYCNQELSANDRAQLNLADLQAHAEVLDAAHTLALQQFMNDMQNAEANLPPLGQFMQVLKAETHKILSPTIPQEDIEHFITLLSALGGLVQDPHPIATLKQVVTSYIQLLNIEHITYEHFHSHFKLFGRLLTLLFMRTLPIIKVYLKHPQGAAAFVGLAENDQSFVISQLLRAILEPLNDKDIEKLLQPIGTIQLDQQNFNETKALFINLINQFNNPAQQNIASIGNAIGNTVIQFAQLNPKAGATFQDIQQQYKRLMFKKSIANKLHTTLNNPWVKGAALIACSAALVKLCEYMYNNQ